MMDQAKLQEVFSDKAYVESIAKLSAEDAAKSLREKGVDVTADDLMQVRDFLMKHKEEAQNGELSEDSLAEVAGGSAGAVACLAIASFLLTCSGTIMLLAW
ncbi:hypothetical protein [Gemmiger sp.]